MKVTVKGTFSSSKNKSEIFSEQLYLKVKIKGSCCLRPVVQMQSAEGHANYQSQNKAKCGIKSQKIVKYIWTKKFSQTFLTFHIWFLLQNRICLPPQLHTAWRHINITFLKKKIVLLEGPILRISFIKGSPDLLKIKKMKHKCTLNWINVKYTQVDLLRLKWRFLQRASDRPKSNAPCWQTLDRHLVIRHQKILLNVF